MREKLTQWFKSARVKELETWNEYMHVELNRVRRIVFFKMSDLHDCEKELKLARSRPEASEGQGEALSGPEVIGYKETIEVLRDQLAALHDKYDDLWMKKEIVLTPREDAELIRSLRDELADLTNAKEFKVTPITEETLKLKNEVTALKLELRESFELANLLREDFAGIEVELRECNERIVECTELDQENQKNLEILRGELWNAWQREEQEDEREALLRETIDQEREGRREFAEKYHAEVKRTEGVEGRCNGLEIRLAQVREELREASERLTTREAELEATSRRLNERRKMAQECSCDC